MDIYGLIGYPVKHSLSPAMHNAAFRQLGLEAEYRLFEVRPDGLKDFFAHFKERLCGANVTIPHKEICMPFLDEIKNEARSIGAVNTVAVEGTRLVGYNTDQTGFLEALAKDLDFRASGKKAVILGAGGAARAVAFGLSSLKIREIILIDLDDKKAASLALDLAKSGCDATAVEHSREAVGNLVLNADLLVNATPCGMRDGDPRLVDPEFLHKGVAVFDLIYNPAETSLLCDAKAKGCKAANGLGMLLYQGMKSFELWTGKRPSGKAMKEALRKALRNI